MRHQSIVGSILVSCGVVAVVVPKWLGSRDDDETISTGEEYDSHNGDNDNDIDVNNNHIEFKGNVNRCPECQAREMGEFESGANNKIGSQSQGHN